MSGSSSDQIVAPFSVQRVRETDTHVKVTDISILKEKVTIVRNDVLFNDMFTV